MRVLIINNIFPPGFIGGYELGAFDIARGLARREHAVEVLTSEYFVDDSGADEGAEGAIVVRRDLDCAGFPNRSPQEIAGRSGLAPFVLPRNLRVLAGRLAVFNPDAVLCFNLSGLGAPSILRLLTASGIRPVVYLMDNVFDGMCADTERRRGFERAFGVEDWPDETRFLFMSQNLRQEVERALGFAVARTEIVPGWFDPAAAAPPAEPQEESRTRFVFVSRVAPHKGIDIALEACRDLLDHGFTDFGLDVFGGGEVGPMLQRVTALRLQAHVRYMGAPAKEQLLPQLARYTALLFPTWQREPFGFVVAEAAAAGCLPVMTSGIGAAEWFQDGVDCLKIDRNAASLSAAMQRLITMAADARVAIRRRAQATAARFFHFESALDRVEGALQAAARPAVHNPRAAEAALAILTETWRLTPVASQEEAPAADVSEEEEAPAADVSQARADLVAAGFRPARHGAVVRVVRRVLWPFVRPFHFHTLDRVEILLAKLSASAPTDNHHAEEMKRLDSRFSELRAEVAGISIRQRAIENKAAETGQRVSALGERLDRRPEQ